MPLVCNVGVLCFEAKVTFVKKSGHFFYFFEVRQLLGSMHSTCLSQLTAELTIAEEECIMSQKTT
jgi:hypothetical protein